VRWWVQIFCDTLRWESVGISWQDWCLIIKPYWSVPRRRIVKWLLLSFTISPPLISPSLLPPDPRSHLIPQLAGIVVLRITFCQAAMISKIFCFQTDHLKDGIYDRVIIMEQSSLSAPCHLYKSWEGARHVVMSKFHSLPCGNNTLHTSSENF
jgi:hypothetical protein